MGTELRQLSKLIYLMGVSRGLLYIRGVKLNRADFLKLHWQPYAGNPVLGPPGRSPIVADPSFLTPDETPDGRLHLFAHSLQGIFHYTSEDGVRFDRGRRLFPNAMRPFVFKQGSTYYLLYEKIRRFHMYFGWLPIRWRSQIELRTSRDLKSWSEPVVLLGPQLAWHSHPRFGDSVSNPCLVPTAEGFFLYYSASLVRLDDCGFNEPLYFGLARADRPEGPYISLPEPILGPDEGDPWRNLGCGSIKVLPANDGFVALMNGIYRDAGSGHTGSAILKLESTDGRQWTRVAGEPLLRPTEGWMRSHVYAFDFKFDPRAGLWRLYFNARNDWHWTKGRENIGLLTAAPGE